MKLEVFDKYTRQRIDIINIYNFVSYTNEFTGVGRFEIKIPILEDVVKVLKEGNYILFDEGVVGIIKKRHTEIDEEEELTISGFLSNHILQYRSFLLTEEYYDFPTNIANNMVDDLIVNPVDERRKIDFISIKEMIVNDETMIRIQNTGDELCEVLSKLLTSFGYGFCLYPVLSNFIENETIANISMFEFRVLKPKDRTINNLDGNTPVVFSFELDNLNSILYEEDAASYKNIAIVAAEGKGKDRHIIEVGDVDSSGIDRIELYVDARDLQPEEGATIDDEKSSSSTVYSSKKVNDLLNDSLGDIDKLLDELNGEII